jgi:hypothetical protein
VNEGEEKANLGRIIVRKIHSQVILFLCVHARAHVGGEGENGEVLQLFQNTVKVFNM